MKTVIRSNSHFIAIDIDENVIFEFSLVATMDNEQEEKETILRNIINQIECDLLDLLEENEILQTSFNHLLTVKNIVSTSGLYEIEYVDLNCAITFIDNDFTVKVAS